MNGRVFTKGVFTAGVFTNRHGFSKVYTSSLVTGMSQPLAATHWRLLMDRYSRYIRHAPDFHQDFPCFTRRSSR